MVYTMDYNLNPDHILDLGSIFRLKTRCTVVFHNMDPEPKL